jgi:hypothetical protein
VIPSVRSSVLEYGLLAEMKKDSAGDISVQMRSEKNESVALGDDVFKELLKEEVWLRWQPVTLSRCAIQPIEFSH